MANTLLSPKVYANVMLKLLINNLVMGRLVQTDLNNINPVMRGVTHKRGDTIFVKRPPEFTIRSGAIASVQDVVQGEVGVVMDKQRGIDISFTSIEQTLTVDQLLEDAIMNAQSAQLAQEIDTDLITLGLEFPSWVGTPGETIDSAPDFFLGPERLDEFAVPQDDRNAVLAVKDHWGLAGNFTSLLTQRDIAETALEKAKIPLIGSVQPFMTQSVINHTTGSRALTGALINGAAQDVAYPAVANNYQQSLIIDTGVATETIKKGDIFTIADVFAVNPRTKAKLDFLRQFVVLADAVYDGGGDVTLTIANPIIVGGAFATVDSAPANGAAIVYLGALSTEFRQNLVFHRSAMSLVFARLVTPFSGETSYATDPVSGVSIRYWRTSDGTNDTHLHRWDILYGVKMLDARLGTRLSGTA